MHLFQNSKGGATKHLLQMGVGCDGVENDKSRSWADVSNKREYFCSELSYFLYKRSIGKA